MLVPQDLEDQIPRGLVVPQERLDGHTGQRVLLEATDLEVLNQSVETIGRLEMYQSQEQQSPKQKEGFQTHKARMRRKLANLEKRNNLDDVTCLENTRGPSNTVMNS